MDDINFQDSELLTQMICDVFLVFRKENLTLWFDKSCSVMLGAVRNALKASNLDLRKASKRVCNAKVKIIKETSSILVFFC